MRSTFLLVILATALPVSAATYKWVDEKGITHYGDTIPPQYVNRGVTEMNKKGQVVRQTEPALTPEQLKAQQAELAKQKELSKQAEERRRRDLALVNTYTSEQEIDLARDRNTQQIDVTIGTAEERLASSQARLKELTGQLEFYRGKDKSGKSRVPPLELVQGVEQVKMEQAVLTATIYELQKQKEQVIARFKEDKARFREIKLAGVGSAATGSQGAKSERAVVPFTINQTTRAVVNECIARWSGASYRPENNYAVSAELVQSNDQTDLVLDGRIQTRTGQFTAMRMVCPLVADGKIDLQGTEIKKALASLGARY